MAYEELAGQFGALSPLAQAGIDPDDVYDDQRAAMIQLAQKNAGLDSPPNPVNVAQADIPPAPAARSSQASSPSSEDAAATVNAIPPTIAAPPMIQWGSLAPASDATVAPHPTAPSQSVPASGAPIVPATVTPSGDPRTTLYNENQEQYTKGNTLADTADQTMRDRITKRNVAQAQILADQKNQSSLSTPTQLKDAQGNTLSQYKPTFGRMVLRGLQRAAQGAQMATGVIPAETPLTPYGAPNKLYQQTELTRQNNLARAAAQTANDVANQTAEDKAATGDAKELLDAAKARHDTAVGVTQEQTALTGQQTADNNSPEGKAKAADLLDKQVIASRSLRLATDPNLRGLSREQKTFYAINGKLFDPRQATEGEVALAQATAAWHRDNPGKQPGLADYQKISEAARSKNDPAGSGVLTPATSATIQKNKDTALAAATRKFSKGVQDGSYTVDNYREDAQAAQDQFEHEIETRTGNPVDHVDVRSMIDDKGQWKTPDGQVPSTVSAPTSAPVVAARPAPGAPHQDDEVAVIAPDGTPGFIPNAKLATALKRGYKKAGK